ncbi:MAG: PfkB family carbohydrate kinase [Candidatus Electryoneaceae bacterium]|nr:PfkB family carbohydrate kinase [Candidatus Electryoneaceae bacterium]
MTTANQSDDPVSVDVFGFGHCCVDYLSILDPYPSKGKKGDVVESLVIGGGPVPTALATLANFGATTRFCGKVGSGHEGALIIDGLHQRGVDTSWMTVDPDGVTARAFIWIDPKDGSRTIALDVSRFKWMTPDQLDDRLPKRCKLFLTDGRATDATLKALKIARKAGVTTVLDIGATRPRLDEMLPLIDYAVVSQDLADGFAPGASPDQLSHRLIEAGTGTAVVTMGKNGTIWFDGSNGGHIPSFPVSRIVDTTGAGDIFHGAFIYGLLQDWALDHSIRFAGVAAALSCRKLSGMMSIPSLEEVKTISG